MRVVFFGTPAFAVPTLDAIAASGHDLAGVVTQPDRSRGRGQRVTFAPVKARAIELGLPILQPDRLRADEFLAAFDTWGADIGVVAAYGRLLPQILIDRPARGMINVHASLLPRWRGAAPIHRAILAGDQKTGVTIMRVVLALDAGPMLATATVDIGPEETSAALEQRLATTGADLLVETLNRLADGVVDEVAQDDALVTYAHRLERQDGDLDWHRPAAEVHNAIRGLHPWPLAATMLGDKRVLLLDARVESDGAADGRPGEVLEVGPSGILVATEPGAVRILQVRPEGRAAMSARDFANGHHLVPGAQFTTPRRPA